MKCQYCQGSCVKKGFYKSQQKYRCKTCLKYQRLVYLKQKISSEKLKEIKRFNQEGLGTSSISRLLYISKSSVLRKLIHLRKQVRKPIYTERGQQYEIDELRTYNRKKENECWVIYAINKVTKRIIDFVVGRRTTANIKKVVDTVLLLNPKRIFTDRLNIYPGIIPKKIHTASSYKINHIERKNLDLRKDLKCLNRKTICYSKSEEMLTAKLKLYFYR